MISYKYRTSTVEV